MMGRIGYSFVYALFYVFSLLPLRVLYLLSDGLFPVVYHLVRYRRAPQPHRGLP